MADFVAVLRKTIDGLADNTPELRGKVYDKARTTVAAKLAAINPPPPAAVAERQKAALEDAIREVEAGYSRKRSDPFAELENVFAEPARKQEKPVAKAPPPVVETQAAPVIAPKMPQTVAVPPPAQAKAPPAAPPLPGSHVEPRPWPADDRRPPEVDDPELDEVLRPAVPFDGEEEGETADEEDAVYEELPERRRNFMPLIAAVVVLALLAGGGYAVWLNKNDFMAMLGIGGGETVASAPSAGDAAVPVNPPATASKSSAGETKETAAPQKFTQKLKEDGTEIDPGPAGGIASIGEGTTVAAATQLPTAPEPAPEPAPATGATPGTDTQTPATSAPTAGTGPDIASAAAPAATDQVAVSTKAIFYEERTNVAAGSAEAGNVVWTLVQESPGDGQPAEPAIHGEATIPGRDIELRVTIRRNADKTLPASHIIELIFLTPDNFEGGGIDKVLRFALKGTEEDPGSQLLAIPPTQVAPGYFLVALNDTKAETETNLTLLRREQWIDVPLVYANGRRALITLEKGIPGDKVFDEVIKAWQSSTSG